MVTVVTPWSHRGHTVGLVSSRFCSEIISTQVLTTIADIQQYLHEVVGETFESDEHALPRGVAKDTIALGPATRMPTKHGDFDAVCCTEVKTGVDHIALLRGVYTTLDSAPADSGASEVTDRPAPLVPGPKVGIQRQ